MRDYSRLPSRFWTRGIGRQFRKNPDVQLVALYLASCDYGRMSGLFRVSIPTLAHEIGLSIEGASKALEACEAAGYAKYDPEHDLVWVPGMAALYCGEELKASDKRTAGILADLEQFPGHPFVAEFLALYADWPVATQGASKGLPRGFQGALHAPSNGGHEEGAWKQIGSKKEKEERNTNTNTGPNSAPVISGDEPGEPVDTTDDPPETSPVPAQQGAANGVSGAHGHEGSLGEQTAVLEAPRPKRGKAPTLVPTVDERAVFDAWVDERRKCKARGVTPKLDDVRIRRIRDRLRTYSVAELVEAVRGIWHSDWHRTQGRTDLELALRDADHVERFAALNPGEASATVEKHDDPADPLVAIADIPELQFLSNHDAAMHHGGRA